MSVLFVFPNAREYFNYTIPIAEELAKRGQNVEYFSHEGVKNLVPNIVKFNSLTGGGDAAIDPGCFSPDSESQLGPELISRLQAANVDWKTEIHGSPKALETFKQRCLEPDVEVVIYDFGFLYSWVGDFCCENGIPSLGLNPSPIQWKDVFPPLCGKPTGFDCRNSDPGKAHCPTIKLFAVLPKLLENIGDIDADDAVGPVLAKAGCSSFEALCEMPNIEKWIGGFHKPVVYVCLDSMTDSDGMAESCRSLVAALRDASWKILIADVHGIFDDVDNDDDIRVSRHLPHACILAHQNVKVFVSDCSMYSVNEAVAAGVPVVTVPLSLEQNRIAEILHSNGVAADVISLSSDMGATLVPAIRRALVDPQVAKAARVFQNMLIDFDGLSNVVEFIEAAFFRGISQ